MSGHSKWSSIKHKKGAADAKRGKLFSKLSRAIMVATKEGGADPASNLALQNAIEKARSYSMPKDNIERAVAKGSGEGADGSAFETVVYEGYGPEGVAVLVEALTDNRNRTASEVRHLFSKHGGNLGATGAVAWQFERLGVVLVPAEGVDEEGLLLAAADAGADDVELDGPVFQVSAPPEQLAAVRAGARGGRLRDRVGGAVDGAEDDRRHLRRSGREEGRPARRRARGLGRRAGRVRELRHPGGGARGRRLMSRSHASDNRGTVTTMRPNVLGALLLAVLALGLAGCGGGGSEGSGSGGDDRDGDRDDRTETETGGSTTGRIDDPGHRRLVQRQRPDLQGRHQHVVAAQHRSVDR